ncbi:MAG TPA: hypothetical protein VGN08_12800 [Solirubrobacteraceae bacterium]
MHGDRTAVEAALEDLEEHGLIDSRLAASGERGSENELVRWWAITHETWDMLRLIKRPTY